MQWHYIVIVVPRGTCIPPLYACATSSSFSSCELVRMRSSSLEKGLVTAPGRPPPPALTQEEMTADSLLLMGNEPYPLPGSDTDIIADNIA